ncbi:Uncharacterized protein TPAR_07781 [Tolypocladium paradoxum]|uniref:Fungal specific transcription factor n=1 Tax=Tolypocladium paradoxum TaxID=94208 RepID=A0A2S4KPB0_9HYPO|nr:Uncharacterized protein TPAR_07781 [Tolypocladium paradoxum]
MAKGSRGLETSMWAPGAQRARSLPPPPPSSSPSCAATSTPQARAIARAQALHRFEQACGRLRWKFIDLESSYSRANAPEPWAFSAQDAERNFKVDFHEFYVWIEQAVVLLLKVFGTSVERGNMSSSRDQKDRFAAAHAYHHNVLKALDDEAHPLHQALGRGDVNHALWKAKELRNRWKDAAEGRETPPLKMYDLNWIVTEAMKGLEAAYEVASARVREELANGQVEMAGQQQAVEDEWEWMVEPMDWEA